MRLAFNDFYRDCRSADFVHFLCQCLFPVRCRYRLFGSPFLVNLTKLSSIDIQNTSSFLKLSGWFCCVEELCFWLAVLALTNFFSFFDCFGRAWSVQWMLFICDIITGRYAYSSEVHWPSNDHRFFNRCPTFYDYFQSFPVDSSFCFYFWYFF